MSDTESLEPELRMAQSRADVVTKDAVTVYKRAMTRSEPFKAFAAIFSATAVIVAGVSAAPGYILGRAH